MIEAWIDGAYSSTKDRGGWASILLCDGYRIEMWGRENKTTSQRMEMMALMQTFLHVPKDVPLTVVTDSAYVMNGCVEKWYEKWMKNGWKTSKDKPVANQVLWAMIAGHLHQRKISFIKVKGHSNIAMNERADELAVRGRTDPDHHGSLNFCVVG
jgi:ribonuclease HI